MIPVTKTQAEADRMAHAFRPSVGYVQVGKLACPPNPAAPASACEPPAPVVDRSTHFLNPPMGAQPQPMRWHQGQREWSPLVVGAGRRIGFTSQYLAGHGWTYLGPANLDN